MNTLSATDSLPSTGPAKNEEAPIRPRRPWGAALLSLIASGLGQVYNGQWKKGLLFFAVEMVLGFSFFVGLRSFLGLVLCLCGLVAFNCFTAAEAFVIARRGGGYRLKPCNRIWIYVVAGVVSLAAGSMMQYGLKTQFYQSYKSPSGSMIPTLLVGDHFMVEILSPAASVQRGDVVIFSESRSGKHFVKRVIGRPGETVSLRDKRVFIDGRGLDEPYVNGYSKAILPRDDMRPVGLGPDEYFLMGDNREHSYDSRWLGPVARSAILGRALYIYLPGRAMKGSRFDRLGKAVR